MSPQALCDSTAGGIGLQDAQRKLTFVKDVILVAGLIYQGCQTVMGNFNMAKRVETLDGDVKRVETKVDGIETKMDSLQTQVQKAIQQRSKAWFSVY